MHTPRKLQNALVKAVKRAISFKAADVQTPLQDTLAALPQNAHLFQHPLPAAELNWWEASPHPTLHAPTAEICHPYIYIQLNSEGIDGSKPAVSMSLTKSVRPLFAQLSEPLKYI